MFTLFKQTQAAACTTYQALKSAGSCKCDPTAATDTCSHTVAGPKWCNTVEAGQTNTCADAAVCVTSATAALSAGCVCKATVSDADSICAKDSYCILDDTNYFCSLVAKASVPTCDVNEAHQLSLNEICKCVFTTTTKYCKSGDYCKKSDGTCVDHANTPAVTGGDGKRFLKIDGSGAVTTLDVCSIAAAAGAVTNWDVINGSGAARACLVSITGAYYGAPILDTVTATALVPGTASKKTQCTAFKINGPNKSCAGITGKICGAAAYWNGATTCAAGTNCCDPVVSLTAPAVCQNDGKTANGNAADIGCACKKTPGRAIETAATVTKLMGYVADGDRACASGKYCTAQREGYTMQGIPTCSTALAGMCHRVGQTPYSDAPITANNGTVWTQAHSNGVGEACFCGDKICGAGRACIAANATGWSGVKADGAGGATGFAASSQCLSKQIDHCPGGNGTVQLDVFVANTGAFADGGSNKACYCDTAESTVCGAGRYCLNNTASGFTGSAECLSSHVVHCTNSSGTTSADEACFCSSSLTCAQGQYCVNGTWFQDDANAAECLAAEISACLNDTLGDGANTAACTCGDKVCGAGQFCDSNTTCADAGTATDDEEAGSLAKPMGAVAVLATLVALFASSAL